MNQALRTQKEFESDLVVVGSGVAGCAAATIGRRRGWSVRVVSTGPGATSLTAGPWDFGVPISRNQSFHSELETPAWSRVRSDILKDQFDFSQPKIAERSELAQNRLHYRFDFVAPFLLFTGQGTLRPAYGAPRSMTSLSARHLDGREITVVEIAGYRSPVSQLVASWTRAAQRWDLNLRFRIEKLILGEGIGDASPEHLATRLQSDASLQSVFLEKIRALADREALLLPPVFLSYSPWFDRSDVTIGEWVPVHEVTVGARLNRDLEATLRADGVELVCVSETNAEVQDGHVRRLICRVGSELQAFSASRFVIATGRILAGGIDVGYQQVRETVLGIPLFAERNRPVQIRDQIQTGATPDGWSRLGAWVDERYRPLGLDGRPSHRNVRVCGSLIGGVDLPKHGVGLGFSDYTGAECVELFD